MNTKDINIEQAFDAFENITPSENWDFILAQKLQKSKSSKSNKLSKINIAVLVLVFINVGFILNSYRTDNFKQEVSRKDDFKIIANELLN